MAVPDTSNIVEVTPGTAVALAITGVADANGTLLDNTTAVGSNSAYAVAAPQTALVVPALQYTGTPGAFGFTLYGQLLTTLATVALLKILDINSVYTRLEKWARVVWKKPAYGRYIQNKPLRLTVTNLNLSTGAAITSAAYTGTVVTTDMRGTSLDSGALLYDGSGNTWHYDVPQAALAGLSVHVVIQITDLGGNKVWAWEAYYVPQAIA